LDENEEAVSAIKVMYDTGVNHLVVSGTNGEIVGIVSSLELVKLFRPTEA
jgi:predicted transcriptional regulator